MYENCDRYTFNDVILNQLLETVTRQHLVSYMEAYQSEKINDFGAAGKCSKVVCEVSCWHKKSLSDFWPPRLEKSKICLSYQAVPGHGNPQKRHTMFGDYLFKYCCVEFQTFQQVFGNTY